MKEKNGEKLLAVVGQAESRAGWKRAVLDCVHQRPQQKPRGDENGLNHYHHNLYRF